MQAIRYPCKGVIFAVWNETHYRWQWNAICHAHRVIETTPYWSVAVGIIVKHQKYMSEKKRFS